MGRYFEMHENKIDICKGSINMKCRFNVIGKNEIEREKIVKVDL